MNDLVIYLYLECNKYIFKRYNLKESKNGRDSVKFLFEKLFNEYNRIMKIRDKADL
jgi:hypothetical protein